MVVSGLSGKPIPALTQPFCIDRSNPQESFQIQFVADLDQVRKEVRHPLHKRGCSCRDASRASPSMHLCRPRSVLPVMVSLGLPNLQYGKTAQWSTKHMSMMDACSRFREAANESAALHSVKGTSRFWLFRLDRGQHFGSMAGVGKTAPASPTFVNAWLSDSRPPGGLAIRRMCSSAGLKPQSS